MAQVSQIHNVMIRISKPDNITDETWFSEVMQKLFVEIFSSLGGKYIFQYEYTESCKRDEDDNIIESSKRHNHHIQGMAKLHRKQRPAAVAKTIKNMLTLEHISVTVQPAHDLRALEKYSMKSESRQRNLVFADHAIYMGADLPLEKDLYPYQKTLYTMCKSKPDDRHIYWIYDLVGKTGKSKFCKFMAYHEKTPMLGYGKSSDILNLASKHQNHNSYLFNLTRAKPSDIGLQDLYASLESLKDGHYNNTKYDTHAVLQNPSHVIVMANFLPEMKLLSSDRWKIRTIDNNKVLQKYKPDKVDELIKSLS